MNNALFSNLNKLYGTLNRTELANIVIKNATDAGNVIVNFLSNTGIAGFKFHVPQTEAIKLENDITDHFTETNSAIQDHIAQKPITITLTGLVGDYFYSVNQIEDMLARVIPTLTLVKEFLPQISAAAAFLKSKKINTFNSLKSKMASKYSGSETEAFKLNASTSVAASDFSYMDLFSLFQQLYKLKSAQTRAYIFFECLWKARGLVTVETTWKRFSNMAVQSISARRDNNADITDFSVTFKQISTVSTLTETLDEYKNRMEQQKAAIEDKGEDKGEKISVLEGVNFA